MACIQWHPINKFKYGFLQLELDENTKSLLLRKRHYIQSVSIKLSDKDFQDQVDLSQNSLILNLLDDECLQKVFGYLNLTDLSNIADVCVRFDEQSKKTFSSKFSERYVRFKKEWEKNSKFFVKFGALIKSLEVDQELIYYVEAEDESEVEPLEFALQYCNPSILKRLCLKNFIIGHYMTSGKLRPYFKNLEALSLTDCDGLSQDMDFETQTKLVQELMSICTKLKSLHLIVNTHLVFTMTTECFNIYLSYNTTLTKLVINCGETLTSSDIIRLIAQNIPNLQSLDFDAHINNTRNFQDDIQCLSNLNSLKELKLNFCRFTVAPLVKSLIEKNVPIECLKIYKGKIDSDGIENILKMKTLKTLAIDSSTDFTEVHLIRVAKELPQLKKLAFCNPTSFREKSVKASTLMELLTCAKKLSSLYILFVDLDHFEMSDYNEMLDIIQNREEKLGFSIKIISEIYLEELNMKTRMKNGELFSIYTEWYCDPYDY